MLKRRCFGVTQLVRDTSPTGELCDEIVVESQQNKAQRRGFTLLEMVVVMTIACLLIAISGKGISSAFAGNSRSSAVRVVSTTLFQARAIAIQRSRPSTLTRSGNTITIVADSLGTQVQLGKNVDLSQRYGVTLSSVSVPPGRDSISFDSRGLVTGTTTAYSIIVTKGTKSDTLCVSGLGITRTKGC